MTEPVEAAITIEALPAAYGDALLVSCPVPGGTWRLLMDFGPDETWPLVRARLAAIPGNPSGKRQIDLAIVSHIDHDHIGAARLLFGDTELGLTFGDIWFNARRHLTPERGVAEAEDFAAILGAGDRELPWNVAFHGGPVSTPGDGAFLELPSAPGHPRLTLLSPTPKRLIRLASVWDAELERLRRSESNTEPELERGTEFPDLEHLAARATRKDQSPANGASVSILLEHRGASALLAADAFSTVVGSALLNLAKSRDHSLPLHVDAFKLSHHGSNANLLKDMLNVVRARYYIVSTNNSRFGHPNDETLAKVVLYGGDQPTLCFNYETETNLRWADPVLRARYRYSARFPEQTERGFLLPLAEAQ